MMSDMRRRQKAPDHRTIARFRTGFLAEACANKYTFVWRKSVGKREEKMLGRIQDAVQLLNREYMQSFCVSKETRTEDLQKIMLFMDGYCREHAKNRDKIHKARSCP